MINHRSKGNLVKIFICILTVAVIVVVSIFIGLFILLDSDTDRSEDRERRGFANQIKSEIKHYYQVHKRYPDNDSLRILLSNKGLNLTSYFEEGIFFYRKYPDAYLFKWIHAGRFTKEGALHSRSWNGEQCSNDNKLLDLMGTDNSPDGRECYVLDLH